jgi:hypothetical protein
VQRLPSLLASAHLAAPASVIVVRDEAAASYYDWPGRLDSIVTAWSVALKAIGADVRVLSSAAARDDRSAQVIVVPSSPCLTLATSEAIAEASARGAGLILTGNTGTHDSVCRPLGYGVIVTETGAARVDEMERREMVYVTIPSASPLAMDIPPGARLDLKPARQIALRDISRDAFYSDYALQPEPAHGQELLDAALTHASLGGHRVVYWGFELVDVANHPWDRQIARLLVRNSVEWAARQPIAAIEPWPNGKRAAASIAQDVESGFANARYAAESLSAAGVRSTFFLTSEVAQRYERLSRRLVQYGEIGSHSENHQVLGGESAAEQSARLATAQRELRQLVGSEGAGLRPPQEQFDTLTMRAWLAAGGTYLFGVNDSRSAAPELLRVGDDTLVLVARAGSDDFAAVAHRSPKPDALAGIFLGEFERMRALGGHYVLSYHSQLLARPDLVASLASVARSLAADTTVWMATVGEVADWWRARAELYTRAISAGGRMVVVVRNTGDHDVNGAVVRVAIPDGSRVVRAETELLPGTPHIVRLLIPVLAPGKTSAFTVYLGPALAR